MSRTAHSSLGRCLAVWLLVTTAVLGTSATVAGQAASLTSSAAWDGTFEDLLVAIASAALVACTGWLWVVTTTTVVDVGRGRIPTPAPRGLTRRLVLAACGAVVLAGVSGPALAGAGSSDHSLDGLPMPDRAVADRVASPPTPTPTPTPTPAPAPNPRIAGAGWTGAPITVRSGDSLWSIAAARLDPGAAMGEIDAAWRALYAANRGAIGSDPDLIRPGLDLDPGFNRKAPP